MNIQVGDRLPDATFMVLDQEMIKVEVSDYFNGLRVAVFAVPGAFTPVCTDDHLPGFLAVWDKFKAKGIDKIACISVNDAFVMNAWAKATGALGKIDFLADGNVEFTRAIGLDMDASAFGMGTRSKRYSMLVDSQVVKVLNVEETPLQTQESSAEALLAKV